MGRLAIILLLYEIFMHVQPFVFENVGLVVAIVFVIAPTIPVISHVALFNLIFNLEFGALGIEGFEKSVATETVLCSQFNFSFT